MFIINLDPSPHAIISLVEVRRALRLRKNYVKLAMYNHFAYTLIFSLLATLAFTIWVFVEVNFPKDSCLEVGPAASGNRVTIVWLPWF